MKRKIIFLLWFAIPLFCMAQSGLAFSYEYDAAGNRVLRKVIIFDPQFTPPPPSPPEEPTLAEHPAETEEELTSLMSLTPLTPLDFAETLTAPSPEYFVEKLGQVEMKIYPNPTTENITLEISGWKDLQTGVFKLYTLTGQLLQEQQVHNVTTTVSLAGLAKGTYILKVHINDRTEDWKVIKH
ncbi:MAG: T9SS type A sorting domain-containing protein [Lentimicrobiaceae bacterium]|nr:T9SS type A sorting domain-containing protein [Lentimicrobiaceae bacterium]